MAKGKNPHAVALGRMGGKAGGPMGGKARWTGVSPAERSAFMRRAVRVRWAKMSVAARSEFMRRAVQARWAKAKKKSRGGR